MKAHELIKILQHNPDGEVVIGPGELEVADNQFYVRDGLFSVIGVDPYDDDGAEKPGFCLVYNPECPIDQMDE